jgi:hypothetical protein
MRNRIRPLQRRLLRRERGVIRRLAEAHRFSRLAVRAERRGLPIAAQLMVQAGRAFVADGQMDAAEMSFARAFQLMQAESDPRLGPVSRQVLADLRRDGHDVMADSLESTLSPGLGVPRTAAGLPTGVQAPRLPAKCPYCGGSVHAEQVDRTDPDRPGCAYCGSPLLGDESQDG